MNFYSNKHVLGDINYRHIKHPMCFQTWRRCWVMDWQWEWANALSLAKIQELGIGHGNALQYSRLENPHGQRSPTGYSPWGHQELFMTEWLSESEVKLLSRVRLLATPWTAAYQAPPSMGFSRQEYWSGVPSPSPTERLSTAQRYS